jgi:hypothetical protein
MSVSAIATRHAEKYGWHVFPVVGKRPAFRQWQHRASDKPDIIAALFADAPDATGYGVACGPSGLLVVDEDAPGAADPLDLPPTFTVATAKGTHRYYATREPLGNTAGRLARGVDTRGTGGYVVGPGSVNVATGSVYEVEHDAPVAPLPDHLSAKLQKGAEAGLRAFRERGTGDPYKRLVGLLTSLLGASEGERNHHLNNVAHTVDQDGLADALGVPEVVGALYDAALVIGLTARETGRTLASGRSDWDGLTGVGATGGAAAILAENGVLDPEATFWESRDYLAHVRQAAQALRVAPDALLAVVLVRAACEIPPAVTLPALVGAPSPLNLFAALVGPSGSGKGATFGASDSLYRWAVERKTPGSGEGVVRLYVTKGDDGPEQHTEAVLLDVDEIDTLGSLNKRSGSTQSPILRTGWSGGRMGFDGYADANKALAVPAGKYRLGLVAGVQPGRASVLLDESDGGTPQRFLWASVLDPHAPDTAPEHPGPMPLRMRQALAPSGASGVTALGATRSGPLAVADAVRQEIDADRLARLRGGAGDAGLQGHAGLMRLRVAAVLGVMDGRFEVAEADWALAGQVMAMSAKALGDVKAGLAESSRSRAAAAGRADAERASVRDEVLAARAVERVAAKIARKVWRSDEPCLKRALRDACVGDDRQYLGDALALAVESRWIESVERPGEKKAVVTVWQRGPVRPAGLG